jgi:hypothetical protein
MKSIFTNYGLLSISGYLKKSSLCYDNSKTIEKNIQCDYTIYNIVMLSPSSI